MGQGLHTLYNLLLRLFRETIAPRAGNLDEIRQGTINLLLRSHMLFQKGPNYMCEGIDVMDFIFQEMWICLLNKKTLVYAPYVMALIISKAPGEPLISTNLVTHGSVRPHKKISEKEKKRVPYSELEIEDEDGDDSSDDVAAMDVSPQRPRMKNGSNTFVPSNKEFVKKKISKLSWLKQTLLCMNVDICKSQHDAYKTKREILKHLRPPRTQEEIEASEGTLSFNKWSKGTVN